MLARAVPEISSAGIVAGEDPGLAVRLMGIATGMAEVLARTALE
ncbi:hypothetical protein [Embleya sp. NPDC050493]